MLYRLGSILSCVKLRVPEASTSGYALAMMDHRFTREKVYKVSKGSLVLNR